MSIYSVVSFWVISVGMSRTAQIKEDMNRYFKDNFIEFDNNR